MKRALLLGSTGLLLLVAALVPVLSQDMGGGEDKGDDTSGDDMEAWKKLQEPGDAHKLLAKLVGDWDMHFKMWMAPGAEPTEMDMKTSFEPRFGGRFVVGRYDMTEGPFPHKGETWFGHDNAKDKYQWIRITDMDTSMRVYEGTYDEKTKAVTTRSEYSMDWQGQTFHVKERNVWTFHSDDKITMEVWTVYEGMEGMPKDGVKEVEITYTRAKPAAPATQDPDGILKKMLGTFTMDFALYMEPGKDPLKMSFDMTNEWALDGQFIRAAYDMKEGPFPHKGIEFFSYNEATGEYQEIRITSMSGMQIVYSGKYDADKKTLELKASYSGDWQGTKYKATSREVYVWKDDDHFTCTVYTKYEDMPDIPNEVKEVEIVASRKK